MNWPIALKPGPTAAALGDPIMTRGPVRRRLKCRKCKYAFTYRMRGSRCPECGTRRDDYPAPSNGKAALLAGSAAGGTAMLLVTLLLAI